MADRNALAALIEAVEAGSATAPKIHDALGRNALHAISAYNGFLDAAKVLHESLLPGWHWSVSHSRSGGVATVWHEPDKCRAAFTAANPSPARAFLLAILRARAGGERGARMTRRHRVSLSRLLEAGVAGGQAKTDSDVHCPHPASISRISRAPVTTTRSDASSASAAA